MERNGSNTLKLQKCVLCWAFAFKKHCFGPNVRYIFSKVQCISPHGCKILIWWGALWWQVWIRIFRASFAGLVWCCREGNKGEWLKPTVSTPSWPGWADWCRSTALPARRNGSWTDWRGTWQQSWTWRPWAVVPGFSPPPWRVPVT